MADKNPDGVCDETDAKISNPFKRKKKQLNSGDEGTSGKDDVDAKGETGDEMEVTPSEDPKANPDKSTTERFIYNMNHPKRGIALIINNGKFLPISGQSDRKGTDNDASAMEATLQKLGFEVSKAHNLTVAEMLKIIGVAAGMDHSKHDAFVMVILSHGNEQGVFGTDAVIDVDKLISPFKGDKCQSLAGKPKLFFIQACRGIKYDKGVKVESDAAVEKQTIPTDADILIAYSVVPGYFAWRNTGKGSWFIQSLRKVLEEFGETKEILWMMTRVNGLVAFDYESKTYDDATDGKKQIPVITSMLTKELYFKPKPN